MALCRLTDSAEDPILARVLYNAFRTAWEVNWWQDLSTPLRAISAAATPEHELQPPETARLEFYVAVLKFVRNIGGLVATAISPEDNQPAAVLCWLPPQVRPSLVSLFQAGWFRAWFRFGFRGVYRFWKYEESLSSLYARALSPLGFRQRDGAFVQIVGTDPAYRGHGYSSALLQWQIQRHIQLFPETPVFLDAAADYTQRVYERLGFTELGRRPLYLDIDERGFKGVTSVNREEKCRKDRHVQRVMMLECHSEPEKSERPPVRGWGIRIGMVQLV